METNTKLEQKAERKRKKAIEKASAEFHVVVAKNPTKNLLLCNIGLMTGTSYEDLVELFSPYGTVQDIKMIPSRSFSFLQFDAAESAEKAQKGHVKLDGEHLIYMCFIESFPANVSCKNMMQILCDAPLPPGLRVIEDFISCDEEVAILNSLLPWSTEDSSKLKHRQVKHFGHVFQYGSNSILSDGGSENVKSFPQVWTPFLNRALEQDLLKCVPDQCTVNRYNPGQGIPPHCDTHSCCDDTIASLSLCSDVIMNFSDLDNKEEVAVPVLLKARSLLIMSGKSRYGYSHGITPRKSDIVSNRKGGMTLMPRKLRISLTLRKRLEEGQPCQCSFPAHCDSQKNEKIVLDDTLACQLEQTHVHSVYEKIASHFSDTRHKAWPKVVEFLNTLPVGAFLADVGCGNGKYLGQHPDMVQFGCDYSGGLVEIVKRRGFEALRSDCLSLPFKASSMDASICIAVIHHLSTKERRMRAVEEIARVLKTGGRGLIYAWAKEQEKDSKASSYLAQKRKPLTEVMETEKERKECDTSFPLVLPVHKNRTNFIHTDLLVPWKTKSDDDHSETFHRYYHVFEEGEVEELIRSVESLTITHSYYDQGNWCAVFQKS